MAFSLAANVAIVAFAFWVVRKNPALALPAHAIAALFVTLSPLTTLYLGTPSIPPDEAAGPGGGLIALPVLLEAAVILLFYIIYLLSFLFRSIINKRHAATAAKRGA